ncbi:MAG: patatin-like phospholipase family protein [Micropepsaceae bacterium]
MRPTRFISLFVSLALAGCVTLPRSDHPIEGSASAAPDGFPSNVRTLGITWRFDAPPAEIVRRLRASSNDGSLDMLALSGGGASGAFGAGALVGLTRRNARPQFEIVTGVSAGALIAPFAFLGPQWDGQLSEAFRGEHTSNLMQSLGIDALFSAALFAGEPLRDLVDRFVSDELIAEVALETAKGRLLLVATTDLDKKETVVWNMGAIAATGGEQARKLFRDVLVASASVPGIFPPVMIKVRDETGATYEEMHVDGGTTVPFFIAPEAALVTDNQPGTRDANVFLIINSELSSAPSSTPVKTLPIVARGFSAGLTHMSRTALAVSSTLAKRAEAAFHYAAIPANDGFASFLEFDQAKMRALFDYGEACAANGRLWLTSPQQMLAEAARPVAPKSGAMPACPVDAAASLAALDVPGSNGRRK